MKNLLKLEEVGYFVLGVVLFMDLNFAWYIFLLTIMLPDIGMIGYLVNPKIGAFTYNILHHKLIAILIYVIGVAITSQYIILAGIIIFSHSSLDRILGYGLKYSDNFKNTHLGKI